MDDNIETIKKRLKVFESLNIPVVDYYTSRGKVHKVICLFVLHVVSQMVFSSFTF